MRILYITHTFFPETLATERTLAQALVLRDLGHEVTILTAMPSYPLGRVFDGYRSRLFMRERVQGLDVIRVRSFALSNTRTVSRILSYLSFTVAVLTVGLCLRSRNLIMSCVPSPGTEMAGIIISKLKGCQLLLELTDVLPENLTLVGVSGESILGRLLWYYYRRVYIQADWIAVTCHAAGEVIAEMGISLNKMLLLKNGFDPAIKESVNNIPMLARLRDSLNGKFVVTYAGSFSPHYQIPEILGAAKLLQLSHPYIHFLLLGGGGQFAEVERAILAESLNNVTLTGIIPYKYLGGYLQVADLFIYSLVFSPMPHSYYGNISAKACDYLAIGRPILSVEEGSVLSPLLERIGAGMRVEPGDSAAFSKAILSYADDPFRCRLAGDAARNYADVNLSRAKVVQEFEQSLRLRMQKV